MCSPRFLFRAVVAGVEFVAELQPDQRDGQGFQGVGLYPFFA